MNDNKEKITVTRSCGNVFKDLGLPDHELLLRRAKRDFEKKKEAEREKEKRSPQPA